MIFFATCGRGLENFAREEINKVINICQVKILGEGKLIFCLCNNTEYINNEKNLSAKKEETESCICCISNFKDNFLLPSKSSFCQEFIELTLLNLKLVEKVFYLIYYKPLLCPTNKDIYSENACDGIRKLKYSYVMERIVDFKKLRKDSTWMQCQNPNECYAFLRRREENEKKFRFRPPKRKRDHEADIELKNEEIKTNNTAGNTVISELKISDSHPNTFRVSCRIRGKWKEYYKPFTLSKSLTDYILHDNPSWVAVNGTPNLDVYVNMNDECVIVGLPLMDKPLSLRSYISHIALRSTICHLIIQEANIRQGDTVLDPMCGVGTILLEAAANIPGIRIIASDICEKTLQAAQCNLRAVELKDFILSDSSSIFLVRESIDAIVCDFPFGKKYMIEAFQSLLSKVLREAKRVLHVSSRLVMLVSKSQHIYLTDVLLKEIEGMKLLGSYPVSLGLTSAYVMTLEKS